MDIGPDDTWEGAQNNCYFKSIAGDSANIVKS